MKRFLGFLLAALVAAALAAPASDAATTGNSTVTLAATASTMVQIVDAAMVLSPTATDYDNDYVEASGASGLRVRVKSNSSTGMVLKVRCPDATPQITLADLLVKTQTAAGTGGTSLTAYSAITGADQNLWSTGVAQNALLTVTTDLRVQNLFTYNDANGGGSTNYTNTLTYTVVVQ
ncbi:MAG: hypothetical protein E6K80_00545 [Candidatus Eisenbacteria bacterium]|uniref:Spore coat protein U domain-containing protein n=1 Tax=Eiseniibacteriota bacterium TaxID=2212470 RepID=A0A538UBL5_UNCEI|nr:MAG: hypothetical protein E6K80_00545 [Candidatus Eisenbacteria bacterium]